MNIDIPCPECGAIMDVKQDLIDPNVFSTKCDVCGGVMSLYRVQLPPSHTMDWVAMNGGHYRGNNTDNPAFIRIA